MFSTDFIFRQQENLVDNQKCQAGFRPLCNKILLLNRVYFRVSVQGVKSLGGHFACLCRGFEFYEVKKKIFCYYFSKRKWKYFYTFNHFYSEKSMTPNLSE